MADLVTRAPCRAPLSRRELVVVGAVRRTPAGTLTYTATRAGVTGRIVKAAAR